MGRYKDEVLDSLLHRAKDQFETTYDRKVYASHSEMAALKVAGVEIEHKQTSLSPLHFEAVFEGVRFIHICSEQNAECASGESLAGAP